MICERGLGRPLRERRRARAEASAEVSVGMSGDYGRSSEGRKAQSMPEALGKTTDGQQSRLVYDEG